MLRSFVTVSYLWISQNLFKKEVLNQPEVLLLSRKNCYSKCTHRAVTIIITYIAVRLNEYLTGFAHLTLT